MSVLAFIFLLYPLVLVRASYEPAIPSHAYHIHHVAVQPTSPPPPDLQNPMNETMEIEFHAGEFKIQLDLTIERRVWAPNAQIIAEVDENFNPTRTIPLFHRSYTGTAHVEKPDGTKEMSKMVTVTFAFDHRFYVTFVTDTDIFSVEMNELASFPLHGHDKGHRMHFFAHSDIPSHHNSPHNKMNRRARKLHGLIKFNSCYPNQASRYGGTRIGIVGDAAWYGLITQQGWGTIPSFNANYDNQVTAALVNMLNTARTNIYYPQLNIWLYPQQIIVGQAAQSVPSSNSVYVRSNKNTFGGWCPHWLGPNGGKLLDTFTSWRERTALPKYGYHGLWHLVTDCKLEYGGLAWIAGLCKKSHGTGWTWSPYPATGWETMAHEIGHNFGAPHSFDYGQGVTGGIMDYGDGYYPATKGGQIAAGAVIQFNPLRYNDVCGTLRTAMGNTDSRYYIGAQTCFFWWAGANAAGSASQVDAQYRWENTTNYTSCKPTCGPLRYQLPVYACYESFTVNGQAVKQMVDSSLCEPMAKPTGQPKKCPAVACPATCGNGVVDPMEVCDTKLDPTCCLSNCMGYKMTYSCLTKNNVIDGAYMSCRNRYRSNQCFLYLFQGEYFNKYHAVPGHRFEYTPAWRTALKHYGVLQNKWTTITAVAGGSHGRGSVIAFNNQDYIVVDFSNERQGRIISEGNISTTWHVDSEFIACGKVTAADTIRPNLLMLFCDDLYTFVNTRIPKHANGGKKFYTVPVNRLLGLNATTAVSVNAFYWDDRFYEMRIFQNAVQSAYLGEEVPVQSGASAAASASIFGTAATPVFSNSTMCDPECAQPCDANNQCLACNAGYNVREGICIADNMLLQLTFIKGDKMDKIYSTDANLQLGTFVNGVGGTPQSALMFTPTLSVLASVPGLNNRVVSNIMIDFFYKPQTGGGMETLATIDDRLRINVSYNAGIVVMLDIANGSSLSGGHATWNENVTGVFTIGAWNRINVEVVNNQVTIGVDGVVNSVAAMNGVGSMVNLTLQHVVVGAVMNGPNGAIDSFRIFEVPQNLTGNNLNTQGSSEAGRNAWVVPVAVVGLVLGICIIVGVVYSFYCRQSPRNVDGSSEMTANLLA